MIRFVRIFLLVLIIVGVGLLFTQNLWVPKLVAAILDYQDKPIGVGGTNSILETLECPDGSDVTAIGPNAVFPPCPPAPPSPTNPSITVANGTYVDSTNKFSFRVPEGLITYSSVPYLLQSASTTQAFKQGGFSISTKTVPSGYLPGNYGDTSQVAFDTARSAPVQAYTEADLSTTAFFNTTRKVANLTVAGYPAVENLSIGGTDGGPAYNLTVWIQKDAMNYYVYDIGKIATYQASLHALQAVLLSWQFTQ